MASVLYYFVLILFTAIYFVLFSILFFLTVLFDRERVLLHRASAVWALTIFRLCPAWKIRVEGKEKIDRNEPWVVVTNHQSMLDIPLMYVLPLKFKWVSKKEVRRMPIFGWVLRMHGDIPVERGSRRSAKEMMERTTERLGRGTSIIVFPEGTRTRTGAIGRFKDGAFYAAKRAGTGILPVVLDGTWNLSKGWRLDMPHTFRVRVLDPVPAAYAAAHEARTLASETEAAMKKALEELRGERLTNHEQ